ncbi:MAG TPA: hypothetical protein VKY92_19655 [Verrucomicrobiae bacterium]|nr:hypothetical protein [Verrucomicrobiae bacterium]
MAFSDLSRTQQSLQLLQRSLERGRLAHAYLFSGHDLESLQTIARTLAKTLNCEKPVQKNGHAIDCCDLCATCKKIEHTNHPDMYWIRPESKSRVITVAQMRELMREVQLKPKESRLKVAVVVAADRLGVEGANAFLKTLEEPPADSVLVLLTTEPQRMLETILSRCLRLSFGNAAPPTLNPAQHEWLAAFGDLAGSQQKSLMSRYRLMDVLLRKLGEVRKSIEQDLTARSPLNRHPDAEKGMLERWEDELTAAIEAEYRRQRSDLLSVLHWWLRDVWLRSLPPVAMASRPTESDRGKLSPEGLLSFPEAPATERVAQRITPADALQNLDVIDHLQRWLSGNVQEALALEVGLLKLHL